MSKQFLKASAKTNYLGSMISFAAVALSSMANQVTAFNQNIALAFGLMTGLTAIISLQLQQHQEVNA